MDGEPGFCRVFCRCVPLQGDAVNCLLGDADVDEGVVIRRQPGDMWRERIGGIEGADVDRDADRGVANEVVCHAGVESSVCQVERRDQQLG